MLIAKRQREVAVVCVAGDRDGIADDLLATFNAVQWWVFHFFLPP